MLFCVKSIKAGLLPITESQLERVMEELEVRCWERIQTIVKNEEGLGIEYDENVICDVCRSVSFILMLCRVNASKSFVLSTSYRVTSGLQALFKL